MEKIIDKHVLPIFLHDNMKIWQLQLIFFDVIVENVTNVREFLVNAQQFSILTIFNLKFE